MISVLLNEQLNIENDVTKLVHDDSAKLVDSETSNKDQTLKGKG
jgi:hypothetical protein